MIHQPFQGTVSDDLRKHSRFAILALGVSLALAPASTLSRDLVVTTTDNEHPAGDGLLSLREAIEQIEAGDTIKFAIDGAGPHYIKTPAGGYPTIDKDDITIDGYSQPGSKPNTGAFGTTNTADLRIVLDSREGGRTVIDYPGFSTSESAILPVFNARGFALRGVSILSTPGEGTDADPYIYGVALIRESTGARIQGCWIGVDPAVKNFSPDAAGRIPGIAGGRSAVAAFRWDDGGASLYSSGLVMGTDGDGNGDTGELNVICGQRLAIHLETPNTRVSGNYINVLPTTQGLDIARLGLPAGTDLEAYENGRADNAIIGTDGDGRSDASEGNLFGPVSYTSYFEFWRPATNVVLAGNWIGVGPDGRASHATPARTALLEARKNSSIRVGTDANGASDVVEANHLAGFAGPLFRFHASNNDDADAPVRIALRGNESFNNHGTPPVDPGQNVSAERFFTGILDDPAGITRPVFASGTPTNVLGTIPPGLPSGLAAGSRVAVDFYIADPGGLTHQSAEYPSGWLHGRRYLGTLTEGSAQDADPAPGSFRFDIRAWALGIADLRNLVCTANYRLSTGAVATSAVSEPLGDKATDPTTPPSPIRLAATLLADGSIKLSWTGGNPPFVVSRLASLAPGATTENVTVTARESTVPASGPRGFFRVTGAR